LYAYQYDQLNRIISMDAFTGFNPGTNTITPAPTANYKERISYDANGNILTYFRNGTTTPPLGGAGGGSLLGMDNLTYQYPKDGTGKILNNRFFPPSVSVAPLVNVPAQVWPCVGKCAAADIGHATEQHSTLIL
jgi:hypothetical protein